MNAAPRISKIVDLPYFKEYLRDVLRPRVEAALRSVEAGLPDAAWRALVAQLIKEQGEGSMDPVVLRTLIEEQLGARLDLRLVVEFNGSEPAAPGGASGAPDPEVVTAKRRPMTSNPLAQAVLDNRTRF